MTLDDDDPDASKGFSTQFMLQNKMSMANNVLVKRRLQLKHWENSDMNKLAASKKPSIDTKVKFQDSDVFLSACVSGDEEEVEDLLEKGANINTCTIDGVTALHQAVIDGKLETVRFLLDHGADLNAQDNEGWTPLHAAVCCGILAIVKYLCERGADLSHVNSDKELAIDLAEDDEIRAYLEEQLRIQNVNADECRDREFHTMMRDCTEWIRCGRYLDKPHPRTGATALHVASSKGYNQLIGLLIRAGANVDAKDFEGWTPLHAAAHWGEKDACRILMENGAKLSGLTNTGQDVLRVADANIVEFLENLQEQIEQSSPAQPPISPNNVLVENNNIPAPSKRPPSVQRLSSEEKHTLQKKDEHDENVSLSTKVLESISNDSPPEDHSISPPPAKKQEIEPKEKEPTPIENIVLHGVKLRKQRSVESPSEQSTFVTAVLPAPKFTATSSTPSSSRESSVSKSNGSTSETISERESSVASNSSVSTSSSTAVIRNTPTPVPVIRSQRMVFPSEERRSPEYQSTSKSEEEASASSSTVPSGSESASRSCSEEVGTGSQISSIRTSSRSVSSKDSISSNLYSSDQNVECTLRMNQPVAPRVSTNSSSTTATRPTWNNSQNITTRPSVSNSSSSSVSSETTTTNTRKVFPVISQQSAGLAPLARVTSPSSSESPSPSPLGSPASNTGMFRKTGPVVSNVQRSASASSTSVPWLAHLKSTSMSNVGRSVSVMNNQSVLSPPATPTTPKAFEPPTPPYRPTISRPIQPSSAYLKYSAQIRSWQTPPTQPAPQKETEAERKAKARIQRAARRSTQGVTADQLNEARAASDDFGKWKSSTLQQTITTSNTNADTYSSSTEAESISKTTTEESASQKNSHVMANLLLPASCPSPSSTPSAAKMNRRSQASRGNRRGTGPVDLDALNNAISISTSESSESSHPVNDPKVTRVTVSMKERLGSSEIMNASKSLETDNTSRFPSVSSTTRTSGPTSKPLLSSTYANGAITTPADASDRYKILYEKEREENERLRRKIDDLNLRLSKTEINGNVWQNGGRNSHNSNSDTGRSNSTPLDDQERRSYERKIGELEYELGKTKQLQADNKRLKDENGALIRVISKLSKPSS